jgi:hypothetical protein
MSEEPDLQIAGLSLWVFGYQFPNTNDFWDGNWLNVRTQVEGNGAVVKHAAPFFARPILSRF